MTREEFEIEYCNYVISMASAMEDNNYKLNNRIALRFNSFLEKNKHFIDTDFKNLINHSNDKIACSACADSLREDLFVKLCLKRLSQIEKNNKGILGFNALMVREIYQGKWDGRKL